MKIGPKYKIAKRLGAPIFEKCQSKRFQLAVEAAGAARKGKGKGKGRGRGSEFGTQLIEKQKARFTYGLSERQFSRYAKESMERANPALTLLARLESRLDNVVYRAGFAPTRRAARQMVSHGHVMVNGRRMNVPSYMVGSGVVVSVRQESRTSTLFGDRTQRAEQTKTPSWMELGDSGFSATIKAAPSGVPSEMLFDPAVIIQFYSR